MKTTAILVLEAALLLHPAMVRQSAAKEQPTLSPAPYSGSRVGSEGRDPKDLAQRQAVAEAKRWAGDLRGSLDDYEAIRRDQVREGYNAAPTIWAMAEIWNALGNGHRTAAALDAAAREAEQFGDVEMRAKALFEAAVQHAALDQHATADRRIRAWRSIVDSPYITDSAREGWSARLEERL